MATPFDSRLEQARQRLDAGDAQGALDIENEILAAADGPVPGLHLLRSATFFKMDLFNLALQAAAAEMVVDPSSEEARRKHGQLLALVRLGECRPGDRNFGSAIDAKHYHREEFALQRYKYRGIPMLKNCYDLANYPRLLHQVKPATIIEIGTFYGGAAIWMADLTRAFGLQTHIYTVDIVSQHIVKDERVTYLRGSGRELGAVFSNDFLANLPRPLLVIEDADHEKATTLAALDFFHPILRSGEYIIVEDGLNFEGVRDALTEFFQRHGHEYEVDADYCDYFGYNVTWNLNGWLRKR